MARRRSHARSRCPIMCPGRSESSHCSSFRSCVTSWSTFPTSFRSSRKCSHGSFATKRSRSPMESTSRPQPSSSRTNSSVCASTACSGLEPDFIGPAAIALAQRYNLDSRDQGAAGRMEVLDEHEGMWGCTFVGECTEVCPKNVDPAGAIQLYKAASATNWFKSILLPRGSK